MTKDQVRSTEEAFSDSVSTERALDLALEALENSYDYVAEEADRVERMYGNYPTRQGKVKGLRQDERKHMEAITAIKQARALDKKAEEYMIYKTFEQWKSGNVLEHGVPRTEYYSEDQLDLVEMGWMYGYDAGRAVEQALDKKAENARELGLDYEPVGEAYLCDKCQTPFDGAWECPNCGHRSATKEPVYTTPPAAPVPLTYEQITAISKQVAEGGPEDSIDRFVRAIEAHHGITKGQL